MAETIDILANTLSNKSKSHVSSAGIKSDKWIRRMSKDHGMIEPFEPGQVREVSGKKLFPMEHPVMVMMFAVPANLKSSLISIRQSSILKYLMRKFRRC